jgi:hypothetical protein
MNTRHNFIALNILVITSLLYFSACDTIGFSDSDEPELIPRANILYPLELGNTWDYEDLEYFKTFEWTEEVVDVSTTSSGLRVKIDYTGQVDGDIIVTINNEDEICIYDNITPCLQTGIEVGKSFNATNYDGSETTVSTRKEEIRVPAGRFEAFTYVFQIDEEEVDVSFAPDIGIIRARYFTTDGILAEDLSLVEFSIN